MRLMIISYVEMRNKNRVSAYDETVFKKLIHSYSRQFCQELKH